MCIIMINVLIKQWSDVNVRLISSLVCSSKSSVNVFLTLTSRSTMLGLLFLSVLTAWKTSTECWWHNISHTILMAQNVPLRPPPLLKHTHTRSSSSHHNKTPHTRYCARRSYWNTHTHDHHHHITIKHLTHDTAPAAVTETHTHTIIIITSQ